jgi:hypothetical protein
MDGQPTEGAVPQQPVPGYPQPSAVAPAQQPGYPVYGAPTAYGTTPQQPGYPAYGAPTAYWTTPQQPGYPAYGAPTAYGSPTGYGYAQPGYYGPMAGTQRNDLGVWALILGILSLVSFSILTGIPAIILGNMSKAAARRGEANNPGLGTAGVVMGWISVAFIGLGVLFFVGIMVIGIAASTTSS